MSATKNYYIGPYLSLYVDNISSLQDKVEIDKYYFDNPFSDTVLVIPNRKLDGIERTTILPSEDFDGGFEDWQNTSKSDEMAIFEEYIYEDMRIFEQFNLTFRWGLVVYYL